MPNCFEARKIFQNLNLLLKKTLNKEVFNLMISNLIFVSMNKIYSIYTVLISLISEINIWNYDSKQIYLIIYQIFCFFCFLFKNVFLSWIFVKVWNLFKCIIKTHKLYLFPFITSLTDSLVALCSKKNCHAYN